MTEGEFSYDIRMAYMDEWEESIALAWKTFLQFEAEDYEPKGVRSFENFITDNTLYRMFIMGAYQMFVAVSNHKIIGMITVRSNSHISLLFVDEKYHRRGIGKALILRLCGYLKTELGVDKVTVNASPFGVEFYHRVGFWDLGVEQTVDGIRYTPMEISLDGI
ncbi:GNAT family N-acetyltransferase [Kineothrix sp. MB12-C1]|uniref:GNAT family N-acetyltransferase n=1 Tax=Kineothrix sp. MB12-C1 TaxID=3070215 RepID=UPI0027D34D5B|nr:GNAT family N-acetyltransferase [Kineothrix sp. MB12-C1]WMC94243.1 GNAT family N-acetyltransferase [Kineothrix sp. MB12-C1]